MSHALMSARRVLSPPRGGADWRFIGGLTVILCFVEWATAGVQYRVQDLGNFKPTAINDSGQVAGYGSIYPGTGTNEDAYFYDGSKLIDLTKAYGLYGAPWAMNNRSQIVGWDYDPTKVNGVNHAYLLDNGVLSHPTDLGGWSISLAFNDSGQAVGEATSSTIETDPRYPALFSGGKVTLLTATEGGATGINNSGQIVGWLRPGRAFLYDHGTFTDLGALPGHSDSSANAINNKGQIVGSSGGGAFLFQNGKMTDLGQVTVKGRAVATYAYDINDSGTIIGGYGYPYESPFVYQDGQFHDLSSLVDPKLGIEWAGAIYKINNAGQIIALGGTPAHPYEAFLLTPIPEPMAALLVPLAAGLLVRLRR